MVFLQKRCQKAERWQGNFGQERAGYSLFPPKGERAAEEPADIMGEMAAVKGRNRF